VALIPGTVLTQIEVDEACGSTERVLAMEALRLVRQRHPGASVHLVAHTGVSVTIILSCIEPSKNGMRTRDFLRRQPFRQIQKGNFNNFQVIPAGCIPQTPLNALRRKRISFSERQV
jgi:hypothetical protein